MGKNKRLAKVNKLNIDPFVEWVMAKRQIDLSIQELGKNIKPDLLICSARETGVIVGSTVIAPNSPQQQITDWALKCMTSPMEGRPCRPARIVLTEKSIDFLEAPLAELGIIVTLDPNPDPIIDEFVDTMQGFVDSPDEYPPYLEDPTMDTKTVADFFATAAQFYKAKPWKLFTYEKAIKLQIGGSKNQDYWAVVMGTLGQDFGLSLYRTAEELEMLLGSDLTDDTYSVAQKIWSIGFSFDNYADISEKAKAELLRHGWGVADKHAYPGTIVTDPSHKMVVRQPNKQELADLTIAMAALMEFLDTHKKRVKEQGEIITEVFSDVVSVEVSDRTIPVTITFPAPEFLEEYIDEDDDIDYNTDHHSDEYYQKLELAFKMVHLADEAKTRNKCIKLAKQALSLNQDCVIAYFILSQKAESTEETRDYLTQAVAAGRRIIGEDNFEKCTGYFWEIPEARYYMVARQLLAGFKTENGELGSAIKDMQDMLELNRDDNQGMRYALAKSLLLAGRDAELAQHLDSYSEPTATWWYTTALHSFRAFGDTKKAIKDLDTAIKNNQYAADYLSGRKPMAIEMLNSFEPGTESEAMSYTAMFLPAWKSTEGAIEWLLKHSEDAS